LFIYKKFDLKNENSSISATIEAEQKQLEEKKKQNEAALNSIDVKQEINLDNKVDNRHTLAEILDVSIEHISRVENCKYTCSISLIFKLCTIFDLTIDEFFGINNSQDDSISTFFKDLSLEKREAIVEFCKQIENRYSKK